MLESLWFFIWGLLWAIYFVLDGFDLGLGVLLPFIGKNEQDRKVVYNATGPFWDGNEVWLITAGGVTFAAFPAAYATLFSALYTPLMLLLFALIIRGTAFEFRSKRPGPRWRSFWDRMMFLGSLLPAVLLGVAFANIFMGIPIDGDGVFQGTIITLLNPYGLGGGLLFLTLFMLHGSLWLAIKSEGPLQERAAFCARRIWLVVFIVSAVFLVISFFYTNLYSNYLTRPVLFVIPLIAVISLANTRILIGLKAWTAAWASSALTIASVTFFGIAGLYPVLLPSTISKAFTVTIFNASSSPLTLKIMLAVALVFVPVVIIYQGWFYRTFGGKVQESDSHYD